jgi:hypothetical protein
VGYGKFIVPNAVQNQNRDAEDIMPPIVGI